MRRALAPLSVVPLFLAGAALGDPLPQADTPHPSQTAGPPWSRICLDVGKPMGAGDVIPHDGATVLLSVAAEPDGKRFGLVRCAALGNVGDLWVLVGDAGGWRESLFTGDVTGEWHGALGVMLRAATLTAEGDELTASVRTGNAAEGPVFQTERRFRWRLRDLRRDRDNDGLSDSIEARLGTSATTPDTDGDGIEDLRDPEPTFPSRALSDAEAAIDVAVHALVHNQRWSRFLARSPFVRLRFPSGYRPFALPGDAPSLPPARGRKLLGDVVPRIVVRSMARSVARPESASVQIEVSRERIGEAVRFDLDRGPQGWSLVRAVKVAEFME